MHGNTNIKKNSIIFYTKIWLNFGTYTEPTRELGSSYAVQRFQIRHPTLILKIDYCCLYKRVFFAGDEIVDTTHTGFESRSFNKD